MSAKPANDNRRGLSRWWSDLAPADRKSILLALVVYGSLAAVWAVIRL